MFGNLGFSEILVITVIALIVFGPKRLPEIARIVARAINQFRNATADLRQSVEREVDVREIRDAVEGVRAAARLPQEILAHTLAGPDPAPQPGVPPEASAAPPASTTADRDEIPGP
jgi:Tat protein translocase TatB subunit